MHQVVSKIHNVRRALGVDRAVAFAVLARMWSSAAGLVTVALISKFLSPTAQGYYYTFVSLVALQIVFELGFSFVILQLASHECAHLVISVDGAISGDQKAHARLASVFQKAFRWYSTAACILVSVLIPIGLYFFATHQHAGMDVSYRLPWCFVVVAAGLTFQLDPIL
jgi:O-antigen/teichoic acid export membrane protein